jgi:Flp pilus assembly protein TadD
MGSSLRTCARALAVAVLGLGFPAVLLARQDTHGAAGHFHQAALGTIQFPNSGAGAAQPAFLQGMALLHSFEYEDAAAALREAQRADPRFAAAFWAEALTYSHVMWGEENLTASRAALSRLGATPAERLAGARLPGERAFGTAVEAMFAEGDQPTRVRAFADAVRDWAAAHPGDQEARAFAALGSLWHMRYARDDAQATSLGRQAAAHAQQLLTTNSRHPGGAHYLIHAYDSPATAPYGLDAARAYAALAPDAQHALHMPSHLFLPLGKWDDMAASNERAWAASRAWTSRGGRPTSDNDWHSLNWLQYAYLQQGRWAAARALVDTARVLTEDLRRAPAGPRVDAVYALEQLAFRYGAETGRWDAWPSDSIAIDWRDSSLNPRTRTMATWSAYHQAAAALLSRRDTVPAAATVRAFRTGMQAGPLAPRMAALLEVLVVRARGDSAATIAVLQSLQAEAAVARNRSMSPPQVLLVDEQLGTALLAAGRASDAVSVFERALSVRPNRAAALTGLARAKHAAGDNHGARTACRQLAEIWHRADADLPALEDLRKCLAHKE